MCRKCVDSIRRGSSPHARGARPMERAQHRAEGIIPACAGSTRGAPWTICSRRDHPRMRGEHVYFIDKSYRQRGSSPHARGAHQSLTRLSGGTRIIPACAGSTPAGVVLVEFYGDHPRMRGEHMPRPSSTRPAGGSSPHARGARRRTSDTYIKCRIIPACAGSTRAFRTARSQPRDHPRMRGEHFHVSACAGTTGGSSPHARGALV